MIDETLMSDLCERFPAIAEMSLELRGVFQRRALPLQSPGGAQLFAVGSSCPGFAMLTQGSIRVVRPLATGRSILLYRVGPGESCVVSIASLLGDAPCLGRAEVEHAAKGALAPPNLFSELVESSPVFRKHAFTTLSQRLDQVIRLVENVTTYPLNRRVAALLLSGGAPLGATHRGIAEELGTVREVVSRILGDFERRGVVKLGRGRINVVNREGLEEIATNV